MAEVNIKCESIASAAQIIEFMAETAADANGTPMSPEREAVIREFMTRLRVGFAGDFDPTPREVTYECIFDCTQCLNKVGLSVKGEIATIEVPPECPRHDQVSVIRQEDAVRLPKEQRD